MSSTRLVVRPLFEEFPSPTESAWLEAARAELGGKSVAEKLGERALDGIPIQPIYTRATEGQVPHLGSVPGAAPFVRGSRGEPGAWRVRVDVEEARPEAAAARVAAELAGGADEIALFVDAASRSERDPQDPRARGAVGDSGASIATRGDFDPVAAALDPKRHTLVVTTGPAPLPLAALAIASLRARNAALDGLTIAADPLGAWATSGTTPVSLAVAYADIAALAHWASKHGSAMRVAVASGAPYHDAGASVDQELGLTLAAAVEYLRALVDHGVAPHDAAARIAFSFPVGTRMFLEAAKLRAARLAWGQVLAAYGCASAASELRIHAATSPRTETELDPWVNMIRGTVEAFGAVVGGADSVSVAPYDHAVGAGDALSQRVARNTHALLRDESHLAKVQDPAGGSFFVESLTDTIAQRAWNVLQTIESEGGLAAALASGRVQALVGERGRARRLAVAKRAEPIIGVSKFPNLVEQRPVRPVCDRKALREERIAEVARQRAALDAARLVSALATVAAERDPVARVECAITAAASGATLGELSAALRGGANPGTAIEALVHERASEGFERLRRASEARLARSGARPRVLAVAVDSGKRAKAKLAFAREVLEIAGFEVVVREGLAESAAIAAANSESGAAAIALSPVDDTEAEPLAALVEGVVAAAPGSPLALIGRIRTSDGTRARIERLPQLYAGADLVAALTNLARAMGVLP